MSRKSVAQSLNAILMAMLSLFDFLFSLERPARNNNGLTRSKTLKDNFFRTFSVGSMLALVAFDFFFKPLDGGRSIRPKWDLKEYRPSSSEWVCKALCTS